MNDIASETVSATLAIRSTVVSPQTIGDLLGMAASYTQLRDDPDDLDPMLQIGSNGWLLTTAGQVDSKNIDDHLNWILDDLEGKRDNLDQVRSVGCTISLTALWISAKGQDKHQTYSLEPSVVQRLALFGLGVQIVVDMTEEE